MIMTQKCILLPLFMKDGLMYLKHYRPTTKQMQDITQEEFMTLKNDWGPSLYGDIEGTA